MTDPNQKWWKQLSLPHFGEHFDLSPHTWIEAPMIRAALEGGPPVLSTSTDGNVAISPTEFVTRFADVSKMRPLRIYSSSNDDANSMHTLASDEGMANIHFATQGKWVNIRMATADRELLDRCKAFFKEYVLPDDEDAGIVYTLAKKQGTYVVNQTGTAGIPLERGNYSDVVLDGYDFTVAEMNTDSPTGRITVLSGSPGTGKTYLVRSLLRESKDATFVLISPHLVKELGDPEILPCLTALKENVTGPMVLILEDADQCLAPRQAGNMSTVQALLNLGDGILGSILDMRILATTNAKTGDFDEAVRRPGRLSRHLEVGLLDAKTANAVVERLLADVRSPGSVERFSSDTSLAEAYARARAAGWKPVLRTDKVGNKVPS